MNFCQLALDRGQNADRAHQQDRHDDDLVDGQRHAVQREEKPTASTQPITGSWMSEAYSPWNTRLLSVAAIARASVSNSSVNRRVLPMARICLMPIIASVNFAA